MKSLKAVAVVAGTVALAGAATPAFAQNTANLTPTSLNGGVNSIAEGLRGPVDLMPLQNQSDALDTENKGSALNAVKGATGALNSHSKLLGGLPLQG
ncbi:hypothetical protein ACIQU5_05375 [Streptomyces sp. NPDC090306]|uniref:hypothetical protein n=1 Tax=unclassified Streptomyces TaxID=2593676 RepID=UPI0036E156F7